MKRYNCFLLLIFFGMHAGSNQLSAQDSVTPSSFPDASSLHDSCEQVVPPDSAYGFVRILERENTKVDILQVNVEIEFQLADNEPCTMTKTTPVELHFPEGPFSLKLSREKGQNRFQFSIHRKRLGPIVFLKDVDRVCLAYDEEWLQPTWC